MYLFCGAGGRTQHLGNGLKWGLFQKIVAKLLPMKFTQTTPNRFKRVFLCWFLGAVWILSIPHSAEYYQPLKYFPAYNLLWHKNMCS